MSRYINKNTNKRIFFISLLFILLMLFYLPQPVSIGFTGDSFSQKVGQEYVYEVTLTEPGIDFLNYTHFPSGITGDVRQGDQWKVKIMALDNTRDINLNGYTTTYWDIVKIIVYNKSATSSEWNTIMYSGSLYHPPLMLAGAYNGTNQTHPIPVHSEGFFFFFPHNATALAKIAWQYVGEVIGPFGAGGNWTPGPHGYDGIMANYESSMFPDVWMWAVKIHESGAIEYIRYYNCTTGVPILKFSLDLIAINEPGDFTQNPGDIYVWEATFARPGNNLLTYLNLSEKGDIEQGELIKFEVTGITTKNNIPGTDPSIWWRTVEGKIYNSTNTTSDTWTTTMWLGYNDLNTTQRAYGGAYNNSVSPSIPIQPWAWFFPHNEPAVTYIAYYYSPRYLSAFNLTGAGNNWTIGPAEYDGTMQEWETSMWPPDIWLWELKIHPTGAVEYIRYYHNNGTPGVLNLIVSLDLVSWPSAPAGLDAIMITVIVVIIGGVAAAVIILWRTKFS